MNDPSPARLTPIADSPPLVPDKAVPILIVDDNASKRLALKSILASLGHSIVEADSGLAALRCLMHQDLIWRCRVGGPIWPWWLRVWPRFAGFFASSVVCIAGVRAHCRCAWLCPRHRASLGW